MTTPAPIPQQPGFGERMASAFINFVRALIRLLLLVLIAIAIGWTAYSGLPTLYQNYVQPVENNTTQISDLQQRQTTLEEQSQQQTGELLDRLIAVENQNALLEESLNNLQTQADQLAAALDAQSGTLTHLDNLQTQIDDLSTLIAANQSELSDLSAQWQALDTPVAVLRREVRRVQIMERLTLARVQMAHSNFGLAADEVSAAQAAVAELSAISTEEQQGALQLVSARLNSVISSLPDNPVLASDDLEMAWHLLNQGLPGEPPISAPEVTATPETTATPQPTTTP